MVSIRVTQHWILSYQIDCLYLSFIGGLEYLGEGQPWRRVQAASPGGLKFLPDCRVSYLLVAGVYIGQSTKVTGTLYVVLTPQWIYPG